METKQCPTCGHDDYYEGHGNHHFDSSHDHKCYQNRKCNCSRCRSNICMNPKYCDCHSHHNHCHCSCCLHHSCRKKICDDKFKLRLSGLQDGLNFRLRQLIGCKVEILLDNDKVLHGKICHVGSNFVELLVENTESPPIPSQKGEEVEQEVIEDKVTNHHKDEKKHSFIFSIDKINNLKHDCPKH